MVYTVVPLGVPSLVNAVDPPDARRRLFPDTTAENEVNPIPLPQAKTPLETPQFPFEDVMVKLELVPEIVYVARVWVDQVPAESNPPISEPDCNAFIVAFEGRLPGALVLVGDVEELVVVVAPLIGYLIPVEGQEPAWGALIGTKTPSIAEPLRLKYQEMAFKEPEVQSSAGVNPPEAVLRIEVRVARVYVLEDEGVMPASASHWYVGRLLKSLTTVWKYAMASAPLALPADKQLVFKVLMQVPCLDHSCCQNWSFFPLISTQYFCIYARVSVAPLVVNRPVIFVYARERSQFES